MENEINPYELLELKVEATEQEIRTAYRQRSLKVHPDKVRSLIQRYAHATHEMTLE
jgi:curved DNA-binding protein CbpA